MEEVFQVLQFLLLIAIIILSVGCGEDNESANETKPKEAVVNAEILEYRDASARDLVLLKSLGG